MHRIRPLIQNIISPNQAAFVLGCWIGENTLLVKEIIHSMKRKKGIKGFVGIKVDLQKAYDRVNWQVLMRILDVYGFNDKFKLLIFRCLSSGNSSLLLNGSSFGQIPMERGIRQGDPLSPFIFVLFLEFLSRMITKMDMEGEIERIKIGRSAPAISHIFFADDILIFCKASVEQTGKIIKCLENFCSWTGQSFNTAKSGCFFFGNIQMSLKATIKSILNMKELDKDTNYLGNKLFPSSRSKKDYESIRMKIINRLEG